MLKWYEKTGKNTDVVLSSRIRLARNTTEYPFSTKITADEGKNLVDRVFECIGDSEYADGFELKRMNGVGVISVNACMNSRRLTDTWRDVRMERQHSPMTAAYQLWSTVRIISEYRR